MKWPRQQTSASLCQLASASGALEPECIRAPCSQQSTLHACKGAALDLYLRWASALPSRQTTILQPSGLQPGCTTASPGQLLKDAWPCLPQAKRGALGSTEAPRWYWCRWETRTPPRITAGKSRWCCLIWIPPCCTEEGPTWLKCGGSKLVWNLLSHLVFHIPCLYPWSIRAVIPAGTEALRAPASPAQDTQRFTDQAIVVPGCGLRLLTAITEATCFKRTRPSCTPLTYTVMYVICCCCCC